MKKLFALILALVMVLSLAACGGGNDKTPSGGEGSTPPSSQQDTADPGADEPEETPSNAPDDSSEPEELSAADILAMYGFTEEIARPDEDYTEVTAETLSFVGSHNVSFEIDSDRMDANAYFVKMFKAVESISDDGKVYALTQEFLDGTGGEVTMEEVKVYQNRITLGYIYGGTKIMVEVSAITIPSVAAQLSFSAQP